MSSPAIASALPDGAAIVAAAGFFTELAPAQRERVAALGHIESYRQDGQIYDIGDAAADLYVLVDGMVRFSIGLGSRRAAAGQVLRRGEVFGWAALVEQAPKRIASAFCISPCTVLAINGDPVIAADGSRSHPGLQANEAVERADHRQPDRVCFGLTAGETLRYTPQGHAGMPLIFLGDDPA